MYATITDIQARMGRSYASADEQAQWQAWLDDVEARILQRIPDLTERIVAGSPSQAVVIAVISDVVIRKINNPTGKLQERIDDYSYGLTASAATSDLMPTPEEWAQLMPAARSGAFSVRPYSEPDTYAWPAL